VTGGMEVVVDMQRLLNTIELIYASIETAIQSYLLEFSIKPLNFSLHPNALKLTASNYDIPSQVKMQATI
jgi:GTP-dependent phosphoenolpyruvate carboxykinase